MEMLTDIRTQAKRNAIKMDNVDRKFERQTFYKNSACQNTEQPMSDSINYRAGYAEHEESTFSIRMILVMLLLAVTMFLKQEDVLNNNEAYQSVMAEIHRQVTLEDVGEAVEALSNSVQPN